MSFVGNLGGPLRSFIRRSFCSSVRNLTEGEQRIKNVLKEKFATATQIDVQDISGGCGAMYEVHVTSEEFRGQRMVKQHKLVNEALKEEIKDMHGLRINTTVPS